MSVACDDVNCCVIYRELYKSMTTSVTMDYSNESLDSSGYEDTERLKVSINRNNNYDVMMINLSPYLSHGPYYLEFSLSPSLPLSRKSSDLLRDTYMS